MIDLEVLKAFIDSTMKDVVIIAFISIVVDILVIVAIVGTWQNTKKMINQQEDQYNLLYKMYENQSRELEIMKHNVIQK